MEWESILISDLCSSPFFLCLLKEKDLMAMMYSLNSVIKHCFKHSQWDLSFTSIFIRSSHEGVLLCLALCVVTVVCVCMSEWHNLMWVLDDYARLWVLNKCVIQWKSSMMSSCFVLCGLILFSKRFFNSPLCQSERNESVLNPSV